MWDITALASITYACINLFIILYSLAYRRMSLYVDTTIENFKRHLVSHYKHKHRSYRLSELIDRTYVPVTDM